MKKLTCAVLVGLFASGSALAEMQSSTLPLAEKTNSINLADNTMMKGQGMSSESSMSSEQHMSTDNMGQKNMSGDNSRADKGMNMDRQSSMQQGMSGNQSGMNKPQTMEEQSGFSRGSVVRSAFTSSIEDREPVDAVDKVEGGDETIYFFTELRDMSGQTAKHRWEYNGEVMAEVEFNVNGPRWRVWSSKNLQPAWAGEWKVSVLNGANEVISEKTLVVEPPMGKPGKQQGTSTQTIESDTEMMPGN